jgi:hypothetical protein
MAGITFVDNGDCGVRAQAGAECGIGGGATVRFVGLQATGEVVDRSQCRDLKR